MSKAAAKTGLGPTVLVAIEQFFPKNQRGIEDEFAYKLLPFTTKSFVYFIRFKLIRNWIIQSSEKNMPGIWAGMICRKQYIDKNLLHSINEIDAVINLGAGFDTRSFRLTELSNKIVFEIDQLSLIQKKKNQLIKIFGSIPSYLKLISVDFDQEGISTKLELHGYRPEMTIFYIMEAVTQYLTDRGIKETFSFLAKAVSGSQFIFTYVRKDFLDGQSMYGWEKGYEEFVKKDKIWHFGMNPEDWPNFLKQYGWQVFEDVSYTDLSGEYIKQTGRELASTQVERIIYAKKI